MTSSVVLAGRRAAERLMTAEISIIRYSGPPRPPSEEGMLPSRDFEEIYAGKGKIQTYEAYASLPESAGAVLTSTRLRVDIPVGYCTVEPGDEITVHSDSSDEFLAGMVARVSAIAPFKSHATAYRIQAEVISHG